MHVRGSLADPPVNRCVRVFFTEGKGNLFRELVDAAAGGGGLFREEEQITKCSGVIKMAAATVYQAPTGKKKEKVQNKP
jgi:hypothetical protein